MCKARHMLSGLLQAFGEAWVHTSENGVAVSSSRLASDFSCGGSCCCPAGAAASVGVGACTIVNGPLSACCSHRMDVRRYRPLGACSNHHVDI